MINFLKKKFLLLISNKITSLFYGYFRPIIVFKILKKFKKFYFFKILIELYDPNNIRKIIKIKFKQKIYKIEDKGLIIYVNLNDHIGFRYFINNYWDNTAITVGKILSFKKDDIFLDIGANIGIISLPFAKEFNSQVISIEASTFNSKLLLKNISSNNLKIYPVIKCLTFDNRTTHSKIWLNDGNYGTNSVYEDWNPSQQVAEYELVENITLNEVLKSYELEKIRLIKIDIEGYEYEALKGYNNLNKISCPIIFEYNVKYLKKIYTSSFDNIINLLQQFFNLYSISFNSNKNLKLKKINKNESSEIIGIPKNLSSNLNKYIY
tara:strand:+ start:1554 stop:2519 length:966 start_codon:yes stop_codon:yes gene_type:complete